MFIVTYTDSFLEGQKRVLVSVDLELLIMGAENKILVLGKKRKCFNPLSNLVDFLTIVILPRTHQGKSEKHISGKVSFSAVF